jgi:hypothetical protein
VRSLPLVLACAAAWATGCAVEHDRVLDVTFDPCGALVIAPAPALTADQRGAIDDALALWAAVLPVDAQVDRAAPPGLVVRAETASPAFFGVYLDETGEIVINQTLPDRHAIAMTLAHELGHAFGLWHVTDRTSVMAPDNREVPPLPADADAVRALWPSCSR